MKTRLKLALLGVLTVALVMSLSITILAALGRARETAGGAGIALELRSDVLVQALYINDLVTARQYEQSAKAQELETLLRAGLERADAGLRALADPKSGSSHLQDPLLRRNYRYIMELWPLHQDAVQGVIEGRAVMRNRDFVLAQVIDLSNRAANLSRACDREHGRSLRRSRNLTAWLAGSMLGAVAMAALMLWHGVLRPLETAVGEVKALSAGKLPLEAQLPEADLGDFRELGRYLNLFLDRLRDADHAKDRFLATMSHEIRTPLNGVIGFLQNLGDTQLNEQQRQYLQVIDSSARALLRVINETLDYSKLAAGRMELEIVAFDLTQLLQERLDVARQLARGKPVKVRLELGNADTAIVRGDPIRLRQVLDNLLSNAVKFTERGEVCLHVDLEALGADRVRIHFRVSDTGMGIRTADLKRLFKPFSQADRSTTRRFGGTGLGLSIAANLVALMGDKLCVDSRAGKGSRFHFTLLTTTAPPEEQVRFARNYVVKVKPGAFKKFWALLVDDNPTNLFLMETICQGIGLPYRTATNGKEAVEQVRRQPFDLVFMDIQMPVMDGYDAIREIRKLETAAATQIIALTASAMQEDVEKALGVGSTGFIAKPFERNQLLLTVAEYLGVPVDRQLQETAEIQESTQALAVRRMYDFMRENYQISLGEIKLILAQSVADWRPQLDDILVFSKKQNWAPIRAILHRLKGQLGATGLPAFADMAAQGTQRIKHGDVAELPPLLEEFVTGLSSIFRVVEQEVTVDANVRKADARQQE